MTHASPAARPGTDPGGPRRGAHGRRLRPAVVAGRRHAGHPADLAATAWPAPASSSSSSGSRRSRWSPLPYAAGDRPVGLDRWLSFAILAVAGWIALRLAGRRAGLALGFQFSTPAEVVTNGPGLWIAGDRPGHPVAGDLDDDPRADLPLRQARSGLRAARGSSRRRPGRSRRSRTRPPATAGTPPTRPSSSGSP